MSLDALHTRATKFQSNVFWRNVREYAASGVVAVIFTVCGIVSDNPVVQTGCALIVAGVLFVSLFILFNGRADREGVAASADCRDFHRKALVRQRDLLRSVWLWYLAPMVPGVVVFAWGISADTAPVRAALSIVFLVAVFTVVAALNLWGANCLQKELDKLND